MVTYCICGDVVGCGAGETEGCVPTVMRGYRSVLVFYSGWAGLCLAQEPNLNFRLLVLFLLFYVSLKKLKKKVLCTFYFLEMRKIKVLGSI